MGIRGRQVAIAVTLILVAVVYVLYAGMRDTMVYYYTVSEVAAQRTQLTGAPLRVAGTVVPGSIDTDSTGLVHRFKIEEGGQQMAVVYRDVVPDTFQDSAEAVVEGTLGPDGTFEAHFLMAKCPSKYEAATDSDYSRYREAGVTAPAKGQ